MKARHEPGRFKPPPPHTFFFQAIVNSSYVGHAKAGDRSHRGGKRATNPAALKTSPTTHTSSEPNDAPMSAAKEPEQGQERKGKKISKEI